jgi:hypothetical protein
VFEKEEEKVPLFTVKKKPWLEAPAHVETDMVLEDFSSGEDEPVTRSREIVLVRKT